MATEIIQRVAGELARRGPDAWDMARKAWLQAKERRSGSKDTRRTYDAALAQWWTFLTDYGRHPSEAGGVEVEAWITQMETEGKTPATIAARLSAVSSFYCYCRDKFTLQGPDGREVTLIDYNPVDRAERPRVNRYGRAQKVSPGEVPLLLAAPDRGTLQGKRDYSLLVAYVYTGRRLSELARLTWGDLERTPAMVTYRYRGKGGKEKTRQLVPPVWDALCVYLKAAGRWETMTADSPLWVAHSEAGRHLPTTPEEAEDQERALSVAMIRRLVRKYSRHALEREVSPHALRHAAAALRREAGADVRDLQRFLDHSRLDVTQVYMQALEVIEDPDWRKVAELLGE